MNIYLPVAELSLNLFFLAGIGGAVGFLLTPLLIFSGVPTSVAVASVTGLVVAASTSGALSHYRRGGIDLHLAAYLIVSSIVGAAGAWQPSRCCAMPASSTSSSLLASWSCWALSEY